MSIPSFIYQPPKVDETNLEVDFSCSDQLRERLQEYRRDKKLTDVVIKVGDRKFHAHRIILENSCPWFKASFSDNWSAENVPEFDTQFVDPEIFDELLDFLYTGKLTLTPDNVHSICMACDFLNIVSLLKTSEEYLYRLISTLNVSDLFVFSQKLHLQNLQKGCVAFVCENETMLARDSKLASLNEDHFVLLIREMKDCSQSDPKAKESIYELILTWVGSDVAQRSLSLGMLLESIPLKELSQEFVRETVSKEDLIRNSPECWTLVTDALSAPTIQHSSDLFCFGNDPSHRLQVCRFLTSTAQWSLVFDPNEPNDREFFNSTREFKQQYAGAVIGSKVYLGGGKSNQGNFSLSHFIVFDTADKSCERLKDMPEPLAHFGGAALNGFVYITGGDGSRVPDRPNGNGGFLSGGGGYSVTMAASSNVYRYCPNTDQWETVAPMLVKRKYHQLVELNGLLYAIGGFFTQSAEVYNPEQNEWKMIAEPTFDHMLFGAAVHCGKIYARSSRGFEVYCPYSNSWTTLPPLDGFFGGSLVSMNDKLWSLGGLNETNSQFGRRGTGAGTKSVFEYDIHTKQWTQRADMAMELQCHCSFVVSNPI